MAELIVGSKMPAQPSETLPRDNPRVQNYGGKSPETPLAQSLRVADPTRDKLLAQGTSGRGDVIPLDSVIDRTDGRSLNAHDLPANGSLQRRVVSDVSYPIAAGGSMKRQQDPQKAVGTVVARPLRSARKLSANGVRALSRKP
jgi:hypothetical protein